MKELREHINNKNFRNIYIFHGKENYLKNHYRDTLVNSIMEENMKLMNFDTFEGNKSSVNKISDAFTTLPFMSEYRVVLLDKSELFVGGRKNDTDSITESIDYLPETTILIFVEDKIDKRSKFYKKVNKIGYSIEFKSPMENELIRWTKNICKSKNKIIDTKTSIFFLRYVNHNMEALANELEKLADYKKDDIEITIDDIENICTKAIEIQIFDLVTAVGNKNMRMALNIYTNLLTMKEPPIMILNLLARQFRLILQVRSLKDKGFSNNEIASTLKIRAFTIQEYYKQSKNFTYDILLSGLKDCLDCDIDIKTGKVSDKLGVELLIVKYAEDIIYNK